MSKGKKRDYSLPFGIKNRVEQSQLAKKGMPLPEKPRKLGKIEISKFAKGIITEFGDYEFKPGGVFKFDGTIPNRFRQEYPNDGGGGYVEIPEGQMPYYYEEGVWDKKKLSQLLETIEPGRIVQQETKSPTEQWADKWAQSHGLLS